MEEVKEAWQQKRVSLRRACAAESTVVDMWGSALPPTSEYHDYEVHFRDRHIMDGLIELSEHHAASELGESNRLSPMAANRQASLHISMPPEGNFAERLMTARFGQHQVHDESSCIVGDEAAVGEPCLSVDCLEACRSNTQCRYDEAFAFRSHTLTDFTAESLHDSAWDGSPLGSPTAQDAETFPLQSWMEQEESLDSPQQSYMEQSPYQSLMENVKSVDHDVTSGGDTYAVWAFQANLRGVPGGWPKLPLQEFVLSGSLAA
eukprot:2495104-Amphidinium_carterae.1